MSDLDNREKKQSDEDVAHLRQWLQKMPHLVQDYDDQFLKNFMRACKGSLQRTKLIFENWNALGYKCPNIFGNLDPADPELQQNLDLAYCFPLPKKTDDGSIVVIFGVDPNYKGDPTDHNALTGYKYWLMIIQIYLWENNFGDGKMIAIYDCRHIKLGHLKDFTPTAIKQLIEAKQHALPMSVIEVHYLHTPAFLEWIISMFTTVEKLSKRYHYHSTMESFYSTFSLRKILPKDLGGEEESMRVLHDRWREKVMTYRNAFLEDDKKKRSLDHLRPKTDNSQEITGTFRKLNID